MRESKRSRRVNRRRETRYRCIKNQRRTAFETLERRDLLAGSVSPVTVDIPSGVEQDGMEGVPFSTRFVSNSTVGGVVGLSAEGLPDGAEFIDHGDGTGLLSWTPGFDQGGRSGQFRSPTIYDIQVNATAEGHTSSVVLHAGIFGVWDAPVFSTRLPEPTLEVGQSTTVNFAAIDPEGDPISIEIADSTSYATGSAILVDDGSGNAVLEFSPTAAGYHYLIVRVSDDQGNSRTAPIAFRVGELVSAVATGRWDDPTTWGGEIPDATSRVMILNHTVTIESTVDVVDLTIGTGGKLSFSRAADTELHLGGSLMVTGGGILDVGNTESPIPASVSATILFDVPYDQDVIKGNDPLLPGPTLGMPDMKLGDIGLWTMGSGSLTTFHGAEKENTWTRLAADGNRYDSEIVLADSLEGWQPGDQLIITSSSKYGEELRSIEEIDGQRVILDRPLEKFHIGSLYAYDTTTDDVRVSQSVSDVGSSEILVPAQVAVGNLSRNVRVASSQVTESDPNHRAHSLFMMGASGLIVNAEFRDLGPRGKLGRYPLHSHKQGAAGSELSILNSAVWSMTKEPGNKWVVIHNSRDVLVRGNVFYNAQGRGVYLEAATGEVGNVIEDNLGVKAVGKEEVISPLDFGLTSKTSGAIFYVRGRNTFRGNVAANATASSGIWLDVLTDTSIDEPIPTILEDLEAYGNSGRGFLNNSSDDDIVYRRIRSWGNDRGYLSYAGRGSTNLHALVTESLFFSNNVATFNYGNGRDSFEKSLFLASVPGLKATQVLAHRDAYITYSDNIFSGHETTFTDADSYQLMVGNHFADGRAIRLSTGGGGASRPGPSPVAHFVDNTGETLANYPDEFWLISRAAPKLDGALYDTASRAWLTEEALPVGGLIKGDILGTNGRSTSYGQITLRHRGAMILGYLARSADTAYTVAGLDGPGYEFSEGTGYPWLLVPGDYEAVSSEDGYLPQVRWVELESGTTEQFEARLAASPVNFHSSKSTSDHLTVNVDLVRHARDVRGNEASTSVWILQDGEVVAFKGLRDRSKKEFRIDRGNYEFLVENDDWTSGSVTSNADDASLRIELVPELWSPNERLADMSGHVRDLENNPVSGATVAIRRDETLVRVTMTDDSGFYRVQGLEAGNYSVDIVARSARLTDNIRIGLNQSVSWNARYSVAVAPPSVPVPPADDPAPSTDPSPPGDDPAPPTAPSPPGDDPAPPTDPSPPGDDPAPPTDPSPPGDNPAPPTDPSPPGDNPAPPKRQQDLDVDGNGVISPLDVLNVVNYLNSPAPSSISTTDGDGRVVLDVNRDSFVTPLDALLIINWLNQRAVGELSLAAQSSVVDSVIVDDSRQQQIDLVLATWSAAYSEWPVEIDELISRRKA